MRYLVYLGFLLIAFMLCGINVEAQKKCRFDFQEEDPFSGVSKKGNTSMIFGGMSYESWYVGWNKSGDNYHLGTLITLEGELNTVITKGDSIMFKLADGNMITCYAQETTTPITEISSATSPPKIFTSYRCAYDVSEEELKLIANSIVTHVRMNISEKPYQKTVKEKKAKKIKADVNCILK